jgi:Thiamine pyrophosphate enzyme, C-terminal TPP binding domain
MTMPIHPARVARELRETIVIDSFTMSGWMSQYFHTRFLGQILRRRPACARRPRRRHGNWPQLARPGPAGRARHRRRLGVSGLTSKPRAFGLPVVVVLCNNSSWGPSFEEMPFLKGRTDPFEIHTNQRYDRMFELMDCHGEHVERPEEFRPALEWALKVGRTTLVNVVGDRATVHPSLGGNLLRSTRV